MHVEICKTKSNTEAEVRRGNQIRLQLWPAAGCESRMVFFFIPKGVISNGYYSEVFFFFLSRIPIGHNSEDFFFSSGSVIIPNFGIRI